MAIGTLLHDLFAEKGDLCPTEAHKLLKKQGTKTSYVAVQRIFYALRQLGLIEFTRREPGKAPLDRRFYRITPGKEDDPTWSRYPPHELYPSARTGALRYRTGTSVGRKPEYVPNGHHPKAEEHNDASSTEQEKWERELAT